MILFSLLIIIDITLAGVGYPVYGLGFIAPETLNYLVFQSFDFLAYLMKFIPETHGALTLISTFLLVN
jgi:hypothetical protein